MKYTFLFLGNSRTGTTSIWVGLRNHSQISSSIRKERLHTIPVDVPSLNFYIDVNFHVNEKSKVLLDGSPSLARLKPNFINLLQNARKVDRVCCLYTFRDNKTRIKSYLKNLLFAHYRRGFHKPWWLNEDDEIIEENLIYEIDTELNTYHSLEVIENCIGPENMFLVKLEKVNKYIGEIQKFLKLDYEDLQIGIYNKSSEKSPTIECIRLYSVIDRIILENNSKIEKLINENDKKIKGKFYIYE